MHMYMYVCMYIYNIYVPTAEVGAQRLAAALGAAEDKNARGRVGRDVAYKNAGGGYVNSRVTLIVRLTL